MRKMKKINGYLVVKFNARELREYEGTALGEYGVIDAELYTGNLDVDRGAMEYDNAGSMEEAVELARGLESELDAEEPEVKVTIVKETDETTEEEEVDAQQMIAGWETVLRGQVESPHYKDVDERTAAHELYGYKVALRDLGLLDREDCYVLPDTFGDAPGPLPKKPEELLSYVCDELCRHRRPEMTQEELDAVCEKCSLERLANEADGRDLRAREKALGALYGLIGRIRDRESSAEADRVGTEARAYYALMVMRVSEGEASFSSEIQNEPIDPENCAFAEEWFDFYDDGQLPPDFSDPKFLFVAANDPSLGKNRKSDTSAIIGIRRHPADVRQHGELHLRRHSQRGREQAPMGQDQGRGQNPPHLRPRHSGQRLVG